MEQERENLSTPVAQWRINTLRIAFLLMAVVMGGRVWFRLLFESSDATVPQTLARALLAALALLSLLGVRYPMRMLPLMLYEMAWKTVWILLIALRAWLNDRMTPDMTQLFYDCVGIVLIYVVLPWRHVWDRYVRQPMEPWRKVR